MPDSLIAKAEPDRFTHESPIRAFTEFRVSGTWAIGKGFRPSLAHLHTYLDALQNKEGWHLVQMLDGGTLNPTLILQRDRILAYSVPKREIGFDDVDTWLKDQGATLVACPDGNFRIYDTTLAAKIATGLRQVTGEYIGVVRGTTWPNKRKEQMLDFADRINGYAAELEAAASPLPEPDAAPELGAACDEIVANVGDDPINPAYYDGTACAEIIEHMPTNVGIAGKYIWRLGEKDALVQECGKAAWYLHRQVNMHQLADNERSLFGFGREVDRAWYRRMSNERINAAQKAGKLTTWRATAMSALVSYTITGETSFLHTVIGFLEGKECFSEYGRGLEP